MMKKALLKDSIKEIKNTYKRFISILLMAFLGVGFFAGLRASSPDMVDTIDKYYDDQNVYDIQVISTLGLTDEDIEELSKIENVEKIYGSYEVDGKIQTDNSEIVAKVISLSGVNNPVLLEGNMPKDENECLVEPSFLTANNKQIGDKVTIEIEDITNDNGDKIAVLKNKELTITGTIKSPLYISRDRGTSNLGSGTINYYIYTASENINAEDIYTSIYITVENAKEYTTSSEKYEDYIEEVKQNIEVIKEEREDARKQELVDIANAKITDAENELNTEKTDAESKIADAEKELLEAKEQILEIEKPTWYILDRNANAGYVSFIQDTKAIENIAKVFPVVFFLVAALISLTSMTRMVEEQRTQIGTLKALGYNNFQITKKYIIYASLACIIGGILGMCVGFVLLPKVLWALYGMMYQITDICISFNFKIAINGLILISVCIVGATIYTALKELKNTPSVLMRPKAPKSGNRVFLEKIPFIWKRLNFSNKVTVRNLFRYKKRFYMTIIGILGCTALILTGFGIKDSVSKILPNQFEKVFNYDFQITLKDSLAQEEKEQVINEINSDSRIEKSAKVYMTSGELINNEHSEDVQIIVPEDELALEGIININDVKTHEKITLKDNEICITDKVSQLLEVKVGDTITLKNADDIENEVKISDIAENYVGHYIFMNKATYEELYQENYDNNVLLTKHIELTEEETNRLATEIMDRKEVSAVSNISSLADSIQDMMSLLNYVVVILIVAAGLLAFVVLYNLANVNISERIRELATIKVLGFYDKEVYTYVTKETVILTIIGIILGLGVGYLLNYYILGTCEINMLRFTKTVDPISYVYATGITVIFTIIVNVANYFSLKKINMIESLKSIE